MKVFVIDDDSVYRMIASTMFRLIDSSIEIEECKNGEIGLDSLKKQSDMSQKTVVLLDINMPVLNGWGFLEQIKKNNFYKNSHLDIYVVSSSTDEGDVLKAKQYDFIKGFIHKPLSDRDINSIIIDS